MVSIPSDHFIPELLDPAVRDDLYPPTILPRVVILKFLRLQFFGMKEGNFRWDRDENTTEILIKETMPEKGRIIKRPTIVVSRGVAVPSELGLSGGLTNFNLGVDSENYSDVMNMPMQISCVSSKEMESEILANVAYNILRGFKKNLMELGLTAINRFRIDPTQPLNYQGSEAKYEAFTTNINMQVAIQHSWKIRWKTHEEMEAYYQRTGIVADKNKTPPVTHMGTGFGVTPKK